MRQISYPKILISVIILGGGCNITRTCSTVQENQHDEFTVLHF